MKKLLIAALAVLMMLSLFSCDKGEEISAGEGMEIAGKQAGNEAVQYSFAYPEEWDLVRNDGVIELQIDCNESEMLEEYATVTVLAFSSDETVMQYWEARKAEAEKLFIKKNEDGTFETTFKLLDTEEYGVVNENSDSESSTADEAKPPLDDAPALKVKYSGEMNNKSYITEQIICSRMGDVFLITLVAPEAYYENVSGVIPAIKDSFKFE